MQTNNVVLMLSQKVESAFPNSLEFGMVEMRRINGKSWMNNRLEGASLRG